VRLENVLVSYVDYLRMAGWPRGLAPFYPHPGGSLRWWQPVGAGLMLAAITGMVVASRRRFPYLLVGWLWYLGTLVLVIGFVQVGQQALADRYTYIPLIGLFIAIAWGSGDLLAHRPALRQVGIGCAVAVVIACAACTWMQVRIWKGSITLWEHALEVTSDNYVARNNLGLAHLEENGSAAAAEQHLRAALALKPGYVQGYINLGVALDRQGKIPEAIVSYRRALEIEPNLPETRTNLGVALARNGELDEAIEQLTEAVRLAPDFPEARRKLERALDAKRRARTKEP
jgi:tetratricopeptide (TPR) repeat protein